MAELIPELQRLNIRYQFDKGICTATPARLPLWFQLSILAGILAAASALFLVITRTRPAQAYQGLSRLVRQELSRAIRLRGSLPEQSPGEAGTPAAAGLIEGTGPNTSIRVEIPRNASLTLGRSRNADIQVNQDVVSGVHARIGWDNAAQQFYVEDLDSFNGTFRGDGDRLPAGKRVYVEPNDEFYLGEPEIAFRIVAVDKL